MISIKNSLTLAKKELFFQCKSKSLVILLCSIAIITAFHFYGLYHSVINNYDLYLQTEQMYLENGLDIVKSLKETNYTVADGNSTITSNPLKEDFIALSVSIQNLNSANMISNSLEYFIFVFGTILFGVYAAYVATYDFKYRTHKTFSVKYKQPELLSGKLLSIFLVLAGSLCLLGASAYAVSPLLKYLVRKTVPTEKFVIPDLACEKDIVLQLLFALALLGFYMIVSFAAGYLIKNMLPVTIFLFLYTLLIPVLGKYDIKNICSFFASKIFSFQARFVIFEPAKISPSLGLGIAACILALAFFTMFAASKRSQYH